MSDDTAARVLAKEGLRHIEQAILMLPESNPQGLRNLADCRRADLPSGERETVYAGIRELVENRRFAPVKRGRVDV